MRLPPHRRAAEGPADLKSSTGKADHKSVLPSGQILDRGRLLIGVLLVAPLGALLPAIAVPTGGGPEWSLVATTPNPLGQAPTARDVLANLTTASVAAAAAPTTPPGAAAAPAGSGPEVATSEVGSEVEDGQSLQIPGTAPDAALSAKLRKSQARFAPVVPTAPAPSASEGPMPFAAPLTAVYPVPQDTTHVFPIVGGASFSNDWGGPRPGGRRHQGIDLFNRTGTPIVAISDGVLFRVGWNRVGGWRFWLRDRWGNEFYHAHLSAFAPPAVEGATVKAGTVIGFVGNTGDAKTTPPHLHFEIHPGGGDPIPPFTYVSAWPRL